MLGEKFRINSHETHLPFLLTNGAVSMRLGVYLTLLSRETGTLFPTRLISSAGFARPTDRSEGQRKSLVVCSPRDHHEFYPPAA